MNVLFYNSDDILPLKSGVASVLFTLMDYFSTKCNIKCYLLCLNKKNEAYWRNCSFVEIVYLPSVKKELHENRLYLCDLIDKKKISFCIINTLPDPYAIALFSYVRKKKKSIKIIDFIHSVPFYTLFKLKKEIAQYKWMALLCKPKYLIRKLLGDNYIVLLKRVLINRYRKSYRYSDYMVVLSESYKQELIESCGFQNEQKIQYIPNPIAPIYTNTKVLPKKKKQIIYAGRLHPEKGVDRLLIIWSMLFKEFVDWELLILGDGPYRQEYLNLSEELTLQRIRFIGFQDPKRYLEESSILCLTSDYEGFPMVLGEAMSLGTIPLSFNNYGSSYSIIDSGINGFLIPAFDLEQYAGCLRTLIDNQELRLIMSEQAKIKAQSFSVGMVAKKWQNLFKE